MRHRFAAEQHPHPDRPRDQFQQQHRVGVHGEFAAGGGAGEDRLFTGEAIGEEVAGEGGEFVVGQAGARGHGAGDGFGAPVGEQAVICSVRAIRSPRRLPVSGMSMSRTRAWIRATRRSAGFEGHQW